MNSSPSLHYLVHLIARDSVTEGSNVAVAHQDTEGAEGGFISVAKNHPNNDRKSCFSKNSRQHCARPLALVLS